jgi:gliding motility-associated-like protein
MSMTSMGCGDTLSKPAFIKIHQSPVAAILSQDSLCQPANFTFGAQLAPDSSAIQTWSWTFGNGQTSNQQNPASQAFPNAGSFTNTLFIEDAEGCTTTVSKPVVVHALPVVAAVQDATICRGDSVQLQATGAVSYQWTTPNNGLSCTNCDNPVASPANDIVYKVIGSNSFGCTASDSVIIKVYQPFNITVSATKNTICAGETIGLKAFGAPIYTWSPPAGLSATNIGNPSATPTASTNYKVTGSDSLGCFTDSAEVAVTVLPIPTVNAGPDVTISAGSTTTLQATASADVSSYKWSPSLGLSCADCPTPTVTGGSNITYTVKVSNAANCFAQDQVQVFVTCTGSNLFVPNTFTPNADGMNDVFYIRGKGLFAVKSMRIYNRWGEMVFEKKDVSPNNAADGWDGMFKGTKASSDTYVYQLEVLCNNSEFLKFNGTISLIR